jgi:hypothetical protein
MAFLVIHTMQQVLKIGHDCSLPRRYEWSSVSTPIPHTVDEGWITKVSIVSDYINWLTLFKEIIVN